MTANDQSTEKLTNNFSNQYLLTYIMSQHVFLKNRCEHPRSSLFYKAARYSWIAFGLSALLCGPTSFANTRVPAVTSNVQQEATVNGVITDEQGQPLVGATIKLVGSNNVVTTSRELGSFSLRVPNLQSTLEITYMGYETKQFRLQGQSTVKISLVMESSGLDEVVIVGYGVQRRSETTGSTSNVKGEALANLPTQSFDASLAGRSTGVQITASAGVVNQAPVFKIRGTNSLSLSTYPLVVVDGVPTFTGDSDTGPGYAANNPLSSINPADIESIDIAKDAAATSIYGSRAANGVVFITTKKGKAGATRITYDSWYGITQPSNLLKMLNAAQYIEIKNESLINDGSYNPNTNYYDYSLDANGNRIDTDWNDYIYQTGFSHSQNINISGANDKTTYYGSVGYTDQEGIFQKNGFNRKSLLFNIDNKPTEWMKIGAKVNYVNEANLAAMSSGFQSPTASGAMSRLALISAPIASPYNRDGSFNTTSAGFIGIQDNQGHLNQSRFGFYNPVHSMAYNYSNNAVNHAQGNAFIEITPVSWITLKSIYGIDNRYMEFNSYFNPTTGEAISNNGSASSSFSKRERWVWTNTLTADKRFDDHSINVLLGQEQQRTTGSGFGLQRTGQTDPFYSNIQGGWQNVYDSNTNNRENSNYLYSLFARAQYDFKKKYFVTANYRVDDYSALGVNNKRGAFWGVSGGWDIYKENFFMNSNLSDILSTLRIRASHGKVGNVGGLSDFGAMNTYGAVLYGGQPGLTYSTTGNPELKWETSTKTDIGLVFGLFNKVNVDFSYYRNNIDGLIFGVPLPPSVGIPNGTNNTILQNVGEMFNQGIELGLSGTPIRKENFTWNTSLNITSNTNKVLSLADGVPSLIIGGSEGMSITLPGYPAGMLYAVQTLGVDPATGRRIFLNGDGQKVLYQQVPGFNGVNYQWEYEDGTRAPAITPAADGIVYKDAAPKIFGGFSNDFTYGNFQLSTLLTYQFGGYMHNGTRASTMDLRFWNNSTDILRRWQKPGDITDIPRVVNNDNVSNGNSMPTTENISSTDFIRLKNVSLSYRLPTNWVSRARLSNVRIHVSGQNLALWTKYSGMDPEVSTNGNNAISQGIDKNQAPNARTFTFGLTAGF